jgi:hypothetical protein
MTYLTTCQIEHLIKVDKNIDHFGENDQWLLVN